MNHFIVIVYSQLSSLHMLTACQSGLTPRRVGYFTKYLVTGFSTCENGLTCAGNNTFLCGFTNGTFFETQTIFWSPFSRMGGSRMGTGQKAQTRFTFIFVQKGFVLYYLFQTQKYIDILKV